ncbi:MAG: radical SAM protein, partial [Bacteroidota bacterium]
MAAVKQKSKSLKARGDNLSDSFFQLNVLNGKEIVDAKFPNFASKIASDGYVAFRPTPVEIFQINVGKL